MTLRPGGSRVPDDPGTSADMQQFLDDLERSIPNIKITDAPPAVTDDKDVGQQIGYRWLDIAADEEYVCLDNTVGAAVWKKTT